MLWRLWLLVWSDQASKGQWVLLSCCGQLKIQLSVVLSNWNHSDIWEILLAIFVKYTFKNYVQLSVVSSPSTHIFLWKPLLSALLVSWPHYDTLSLVSRWTLYIVHLVNLKFMFLIKTYSQSKCNGLWKINCSFPERHSETLTTQSQAFQSGNVIRYMLVTRPFAIHFLT